MTFQNMYEQSNVIFNKNIGIMILNHCLRFYNYMFIVMVFQYRGKVFKAFHQCLIELQESNAFQHFSDLR